MISKMSVRQNLQFIIGYAKDKQQCNMPLPTAGTLGSVTFAVRSPTFGVRPRRENGTTEVHAPITVRRIGGIRNTVTSILK